MANTAFDHASALTIPGSTTNNGLVRWGDTSGTSFGNITGITSDGSNITLLTRGEIRFSDADSTHFIAFESPATVSTSYTMTLPSDLPAADEVLTVTSYSSGAGVLEWAAVGVSGVNTTITGLTGLVTQNALELDPFNTSAGNTGEIRFKELAANGAHYAAIKAPDSIAANYTLVLPVDDGASSQFLQTNGSGTLTWAAAGGGGGASAVQVNDNVAFATGTGSDSKIYYDGTDTHWDLRDTGTGDLIIALGASHPSPDPGTVHIWEGDAGSVAPSTDTQFIIENSGNAGMTILTPANATAQISFGSPTDNRQGSIYYNHSTNTMSFRTAQTDRVDITTSSVDLKNNTLLNVGDAGNDWTANTVTLQHDADNVQMQFKLYNTSSSGSGSAAFKTRCYAGTGDPITEYEITSGGQFLIGVDNSNGDLFTLGGHGQGLGGNDTFRVTQGTPPVLSLNTGLGSNFDYVCSNCGNHDLEMFTCCGVVEWHDDVLALRKAGVDLATMDNPYAIGQSLNIAHLVKLGIMDYDDKEEDPVALANRKTPWLGLNISNGLMFTWAGMWQTRERMDNQYQELKDTIQELKAEVDALRG